ncbi:MAG: radical SAM protein [Patescibacteria group bacterium]|nr:radical SAM protein [Patescibacteria group bacterium]
MQDIKFSRFNAWTYTENHKLILYNSMTGALAVFEKPQSNEVLIALEENQVSFIPAKLISILIEDGYIVKNGIDELKKINDLVNERQNLTDEYFFSILLNLDCNFKCFYCFESHTGEYLDNTVSQRIISMIDKASKSAKKISVDWYGGEPLLSIDRLRFLNSKFMEICSANGIQYCTSITTNGYLLTPSVIEYLKTVPLSHLQITLDGPAETHNISRPLKNGNPTFDIILKNIKTAVDQGIEVMVRVNITKINIDLIPKLYQAIEDQGLKNKVQIMLRPVVSSSANPCMEYCLSENVLAGKVADIYKQMAKKGWVIFPDVDNMQCMGFCHAEFPSRFIINTQGNLYKCGELFTPEEAVGKINDKGELVLDQKKSRQFVDKNPLDFPECKNCNILPICMGGCSMKRFWGGTNCCDEFKYALSKFLEVLVLNQYAINGGDKHKKN